MRIDSRRPGSWWWIAALGALLVTLAGCDPTIKATVENGVITTSQSLFGALMRAIFALIGEAKNPTTTAALFPTADSAAAFFA